MYPFICSLCAPLRPTAIYKIKCYTQCNHPGPRTGGLSYKRDCCLIHHVLCAQCISCNIYMHYIYIHYYCTYMLDYCRIKIMINMAEWLIGSLNVLIIKKFDIVLYGIIKITYSTYSTTLFFTAMLNNE